MAKNSGKRKERKDKQASLDLGLSGWFMMNLRSGLHFLGGGFPLFFYVFRHFFKSRNLVWCFLFFFHLPGSWIFFFPSVFSDFNICLVLFFLWFGGLAISYFYFYFYSLPYYSSGTGMGAGGGGRYGVHVSKDHGDENLVHNGTNRAY